MSKKFKEWHTVKEKLHKETKKVIVPKEREVYWASIGVNIGHEQDGKGNIFSRPVLVLKRYNKNLFFGIPLSTQIKQGSFFFEFELNGKKSNALIVQGRIYDTKRLENRMGMVSSDDFNDLKKKLKELLDV
ncbi:MAG: type II toxin-antitoxin system PemK/MazF family toxin [Epsilonproteobacteria bacterium]|nr:MAG: type II toxin-antitoxin system PemK/MazF family toxin [Campylobacterota bacterium]